jgi:uncharacterized surface protein with fasciclin (FAS1) repeats
MKQIFPYKPFLAAFLILLLFPACNDYYNDYYREAGDGEQDKLPSLMELIRENDDLSVFAAFLQKLGYDSILAGEQTYTVFAPVNAALVMFDPADSIALANLVKTHIARFSYSAIAPGEVISDRPVTMVNGKIIPFTTDGSRTLLGNQEMASKNRRAKNGILHTLKTIVPFQPNLWEILTDQETDSIRNYLYSFSTKKFNRFGSLILDYVNGLPVYDSIFIESNILFDTYPYAKGIGYLNTEDSLYSMILPTNTAWREAYDLRKDYFVSEDDSLQHANTQYSIVKDLVFRGILLPESLVPGDTLFSTRYTPFLDDPASLFEGSERLLLSNGLAYRTDKLHYKAWESWQPEILCEAEFNRGYSENVIGPFIRRSSDTLVSEGMYLAVSPQAASSPPIVCFDIPKTLSAAYNIYAVFVPERYEYPADSLGQARIRFQVQQLDRSTAGKSVDEQIWTNILSGGDNGGAAWTTPPDPLTGTTEVKKMLLAENFKFPLANIEELHTTIRIAISNFRSRGDNTRYFQYRMFIDCIILEPVKN